MSQRLQDERKRQHYQQCAEHREDDHAFSSPSDASSSC
jgi:hypothetical protein